MMRAARARGRAEVAAGIGLALLLATSARAASPGRCAAPGVFVADRTILREAVDPAPGGRGVRLESGPSGLQVTVGTRCPTVPAQLVREGKGTRVRTKAFACPTDQGSVRLKLNLKIAGDACDLLRGQVLFRGRGGTLPQFVRGARSRCGDGYPDAAGEACDAGEGNSDTLPNACRTDCSAARCGDGVTDPARGETCDPPNDVSGCSPTCELILCGNGVRNTGEACDDGDQVDGDGCDSNCTPTGCGNGIQTAGEECDDGDANSNTAPNACRVGCTLPHCGDGVVDGLNGEECDDGNLVNDGTDGCGCCYAQPVTHPTLGPGDRCSDAGCHSGLPGDRSTKPPLDDGVPDVCKPASALPMAAH